MFVLVSPTKLTYAQFRYVTVTHCYRLLHVSALSDPSSGGRQIQVLCTTSVYIVIRKCSLYTHRT